MEYDDALVVCTHPWAADPQRRCKIGPWDGCPNRPEVDLNPFTTTGALAETGPQALVGHQRKGNRK